MNREIVLLEDSSKSKFGGGQRISLLVLKILAKNNKLILFDTNTTSIFYKKAICLVESAYKLESFGMMKPGIISLIIKFIELITLPVFTIFNLKKLDVVVKGKRDVLLFATTKKMLVYAYLVKLLYGNSFVYHAHLVENNSIVRFFYIRILRSAKNVIAVSDTVKNNIGLLNVVKIHNPIVIIEKTMLPKKIEKKVIVATFSTLISIKGIIYFIKSFEYLKNTTEVEYWVFGEGPDKEKLGKYSSENIIFKGFCEDVIKEISQSVHVLCFPSIIEESFGMVILEALSCGVPVITTNIGGQAELIEDGFNGFHVPIKDPENIAQKITELIEDQEQYELFSMNAICSSHQFSSSIFSDKLEQLMS